MDEDTWKALLELIKLVISIAMPILTSTIAIVWAVKFNAYQQAAKRDDTYLGWLRGLLAESEHLLKSSADEILKVLRENVPGNAWSRVFPTKRFSHDFIEAAKKGIVDHPCSETVFLPLTELHRNSVHTNEMLDRYEENNGLHKNVVESVETTAGSIDKLCSVVRDQIRHTESERRGLWWHLKNEWVSDKPTNISSCNCKPTQPH